MPNKKTKTVKIRHLECFSAIYGELAQNPEYAGYEIEEAVLQVKSYIPPAVKDVDKAIEKIRFSHATRKYKYPVFEGRELIDQSSSVPRLHYVFDVSDTGVRRNSRDPEVWQLGPDLVQPVSEMLAKIGRAHV